MAQDKKPEGRSTDPDEATVASPKLLPTARLEMEFAYESRLMSWDYAPAGYPVIQIVTPGKKFAEALKALIEREHGPIRDMVVGQSEPQMGRWVVQIPAWPFKDAGLFPGGMTIHSFKTWLPKHRASGDLSGVQHKRDGFVPKYDGPEPPLKSFWVQKMKDVFQGRDKGKH